MGRPPGPESTTFSIRLDNETLARIDQAAEHAGDTRSTYILSWLPEYYNDTTTRRARATQNAPNGQHNNAR